MVALGASEFVVSSSSPSITENLAQFECWALKMLRCELEREGDQSWRALLPENLRSDWDNQESLRFHVPSSESTNGETHEEGTGNGSSATLEICPKSPLFEWTLQKLQSEGPVVHAIPAAQPAGVHEITPQLFERYSFVGGHIHLAGCSLEDRLIIRLTFLAESDDEPLLRHRFVWPDGSAVEPEIVESLGLGELMPCEGRPLQSALAMLNASLESLKSLEENEPHDVLTTTAIWCKYAEGKIAFEFGEKAVHVPFSGWASEIANGHFEPQPYVCPLTHRETFDLGVTDDGRIAAADGIVTCEESGRRLLASEVEKCAATGKHVDSELLSTCSVSGERVLSSSLHTCTQCGQTVSINTIKGGRCLACRNLAPIRKDEPRMARLLDEYPKLDGWPRWRIAETDSVYVLLATSWLKQLSLVVEKETLEVTHAVTSGRLLTNWQELSSEQQEELLGREG